MALNANTLGQAITDIENEYNEVDIADLPATRLEINKRIAGAIIEHFKNNGVIIPNTMAAPAGGGPVIGSGKIQ